MQGKFSKNTKNFESAGGERRSKLSADVQKRLLANAGQERKRRESKTEVVRLQSIVKHPQIIYNRNCINRKNF